MSEPEPNSNAAPGRGRLTNWLRILVSLSLLALLFWLVDLTETLERLRRIDLRLAPCLIAVNTAAFALFALRWSWFCRRLGLLFPYRHFLGGIYRFQVFCQVMPSSLLGEAARFSSFPRGTAKKLILKSIALDRLANQGSLVVLVTLLVPYYWGLELPSWGYPLLLLPPLLLIVVLASVRIARHTAAADGFLRRRLGFLRLLLRDRSGMVPLGIGLLLSLAVAVEFLFAVLAVHGPVENWVQLMLLVPLLTLALTVLPISFAEWGTREMVSLAVLHPLGLSAEEIVAASFLVGITNLISCLPGLYFTLRRRSPPAP